MKNKLVLVLLAPISAAISAADEAIEVVSYYILDVKK